MKRFALSVLMAAFIACGAISSVYAQEEDSSAYAQKQKETMTSDTKSAELLRVLEEQQQYSTVVDALKKTGLHQSLGNGEYTLFAPTDRAFAGLRMPVSEMKVDELADLLRNHILLTSYTVEQLAKQSRVQNVQGTNLKIENGGQRVEGAQVADSNLEVANGVVYGINSVITLEARSAAVTTDSTRNK